VLRKLQCLIKGLNHFICEGITSLSCTPQTVDTDYAAVANNSVGGSPSWVAGNLSPPVKILGRYSVQQATGHYPEPNESQPLPNIISATAIV
jgi:hypothetical protein